MPKLSVVIITFNEEKNIARCLDSVKDIADDIVVVDSFSTDNTPAICAKYPVNFIQRKWEGYSLTKNFGNSCAQNDWVLSIDADEAVSEELKKSIVQLKKQDTLFTCKFNRLTNYCGKWVKHGGWYPDTKIRIFNRIVTQWKGVIHEELAVDKNTVVKHLKGDCYHYTYYNVHEHYKQTEKFTTIAAQDLFNQKKQVTFVNIYVSPLIKFVKDFFVKLGFLDGLTGLTIARISAYATYLKYKKLYDLNKCPAL
jgi:glycosyltransferase involved in cell wall biosynthesis